MNDLDERSPEQCAQVERDARAASNAAALVALYFSDTVRNRSTEVGDQLEQMHRARLGHRLRDSELKAKNTAAKQAQDALISAMARDLGESTRS